MSSFQKKKDWCTNFFPRLYECGNSPSHCILFLSIYKPDSRRNQIQLHWQVNLKLQVGQRSGSRVACSSRQGGDLPRNNLIFISISLQYGYLIYIGKTSSKIFKKKSGISTIWGAWGCQGRSFSRSFFFHFCDPPLEQQQNVAFLIGRGSVWCLHLQLHVSGLDVRVQGMYSCFLFYEIIISKCY